MDMTDDGTNQGFRVAIRQRDPADRRLGSIGVLTTKHGLAVTEHANGGG